VVKTFAVVRMLRVDDVSSFRAPSMWRAGRICVVNEKVQLVPDVHLCAALQSYSDAGLLACITTKVAKGIPGLARQK
jgi:hypothetical protein